jgi:hypothetical protein
MGSQETSGKYSNPMEVSILICNSGGGRLNWRGTVVGKVAGANSKHSTGTNSSASACPTCGKNLPSLMM